MVFASDLDRTLIFSKRVIEQYPSNTPLKVIETIENREVSYIPTRALYELKQLKSKETLFVPITTRSIAEYKRVNFGINSKYAITSSGGTILYYGKPLKEWDRFIRKEKNLTLLNNLKSDINNLRSINYNTKIIDNSYIFSKTINAEECRKEIQKLCIKYPRVEFTIQRDKVYGILSNMTKLKALAWLMDKLNENLLIAAGDSELDIPFMRLANVSISPLHGTAFSKFGFNPTHLTSFGVDSAIQTLDIVNSYK